MVASAHNPAARRVFLLKGAKNPTNSLRSLRVKSNTNQMSLNWILLRRSSSFSLGCRKKIGNSGEKKKKNPAILKSEVTSVNISASG